MDLSENSVRELIQENNRSKWIAHSNHNVKCFTENEIRRMTNNYKTILGGGSFGVVYEGALEDTSMVAVKKFIHNVKENFAKEVIVHREINHKNVVRLIGYCVDENALVMVTEYIGKGNLSNILHDNSIPIPLDTRLRIATECAEALGYMHSQMYTQVIHGDIKPANILLDDGLRAKVSDFGISRLVNTDNTLYTLNVIGSIGYMDPLFARNGRLTAKSDVYSFGVVLLELITRRKARTEGTEIGLVESFTQALARGIKRVRAMFDSNIATPGNMKTIEEIAKLAGKCLSMKLDKRPEMLEVAVHIRKLSKAIHQGQERLPLFSWGMRSKSKPPANTGPSEESIRSTQKVISVGSIETAVQLELKDLYQAPGHILGRGTFGLTYSLKCLGGTELLVKLKTLDGWSLALPEAEFERRITSIGAIQNNKHIVPLRGYYYNNEKVLLLYDNMPLGSLARALHGDRRSSQAPLEWERRSAISLAVARGVAFIHSFGPSSIHGNIKSSNVLLSSTHDACVSDHGLSTLLTDVACPWASLSQESDVYSFGLLLLELFTRKAPLDNERKGVDLLRWVRSVALEKWAVDVLDVELLGQQYKFGQGECMIQLLLLAINCCSKDANLRPAMCHVVQRIENIRQSKLVQSEDCFPHTCIHIPFISGSPIQLVILEL